jgi:hypothetical protein
MQHREPSLRGYGAGEDGGGRAHVAEVLVRHMRMAFGSEPRK